MIWLGVLIWTRYRRGLVIISRLGELLGGNSHLIEVFIFGPFFA
jgi:hypothetical protein